MRKKALWLLIIGVLVTAIAYGLWRYSAREVDVRLEGLKYRLGTINASEVEPATIQIEGTVRRTLSGKREFRGTVEIEGESIPVKKEIVKNLTFSARKGEAFHLIYPWYDGEGNMYSFQLGDLYANDDFSQVTLTLYDQREDGSRYWGGDDGLMLTAPAKDRTDAVRLANKLMAHRLEGLQPLK
ncbi:hypothetical protein H8B09_06810 [Paenibacillus sp. PR3]|uniref:Uncharacterized protein n=1 Tax=Paenibacillus terricola TaxID=2763503 RepID=A0ABR8MR46_9BACL|nr:hypothetical protein [Paenibacillus terricola]MBD3918459.1 hypothetical protein [Paenibacillus terricola]